MAGAQVQAASYIYGNLSPGDAYAGIRLDFTGAAQKVAGSSLIWSTAGYNWLLWGSAGDYYVRCTYTGSAPSGSATSTWLQLNVSRNWYYEVTATGTLAGTMTISIATDSGGTNIISTADVYLEASVEI